MQEVSDAGRPGDDMVDGDLGDGTRVRAPLSFTRQSSASAASTATPAPGAEPLQASAAILQSSGWKLEDSGSLSDMSKDELREKLLEAREMLEVMQCELEVARRHLEGKYEALRILQGKAILDTATPHTKSMLQKSEQKAKALETELNTLQWELSFTQLQMKKSEESWEQRYNRLVGERRALDENLQERESEKLLLQAENAALNQQCLELLSMLSVKEQRTYQGSKPQYGPERDASVLELAVLGACKCLSGANACPCSRTAAATRKQLVQLQQELDVQHSQREEALMVADAFRIAFEQQLRKRSDQFMLLAEANALQLHQLKPNGPSRNPLSGVGQRLRGLLPSSVDVKGSEDVVRTLHRLIELLNDKEEALAHQRKVSIMLAHSAEELHRQLHLDSPCWPSESAQPDAPAWRRGQPPQPSGSSAVQPPPSECSAPPSRPCGLQLRSGGPPLEPPESSIQSESSGATQNPRPDPCEEQKRAEPVSDAAEADTQSSVHAHTHTSDSQFQDGPLPQEPSHSNSPAEAHQSHQHQS